MSATCLKTVAVVLLCGFVGVEIHAADDPARAKQSAESAEMQRQMEAAAEHYSHFATGDIVANSPTDRRWPEKLAAEHLRLLADLQKWATQPQAVRTLIGHRNPKVRTLALGALFVREDSHELPLIASLTGDASPTFLHAHGSLNSAPLLLSLAEFESPQTVGQAAQAMIAHYLRAASVRADCGFAEYWRAREGRQACASWFLVRINRAAHNTSPLQPKYRPDVERLISEIEALPAAERAWTQVYLRCMSFPKLDDALTDSACLAALQKIGSDQIVRFLQRQRVTDDPDLRFDNVESNSSRIHSWMAHFILRHVRELLRAEDAPALLAREEVERTTPQISIGVSPSWAAAAAELIGDSDPAAADKIIDAALGRFPLSDILGSQCQAVLIASRWRIHGIKQKQEILDWFYRAQAKATQSQKASDGHVQLLASVHAAAREGTQKLMAALVADPRFDQTDWSAIKELLDIASEGLPEPLVSPREVHSVWPPRDGEALKAALAKWREILKRRYQP